MVPTNYIYEALKRVIPTDYPTKFGIIDTSNVDDEKAKIVTNTAVIYLKSANNPDREIDGTITMEYIRAVFNVYTDRGGKGVRDGYDYCSRVCGELDKLFNRTFNIDNKCFTILNSRRLGNYEYLGPTKQGIQTFSINYLIQFEGGN